MHLYEKNSGIFKKASQIFSMGQVNLILSLVSPPHHYIPIMHVFDDVNPYPHTQQPDGNHQVAITALAFHDLDPQGREKNHR